MASWRQSTSKQYQSYLKRWVEFCVSSRNVRPACATVQDGLAFLTHLFKQGLGYSAINTARSALSTVLSLGEKSTFGEHPLVIRFLKGIFELKPSLPRHSIIWDVRTVLDHFRSMPDMSELSLKQLTLKLVTLLALTTTQRCQTLAYLDTQFMQKTPSILRLKAYENDAVGDGTTD